MRHKKTRILPAQLNPPHSSINVAPLVDVVLVLLIVFMVLAPLLEKTIAIHLPEDNWVDNIEEMPQGQLVVSVDKTGTLYLNQQSLPEGDYVHKLSRVLAAKNNHAERVVFFSIDGQAGYERVVFALDGARQAGALALGLLVAPLENTPVPPTEESMPLP
ncbi:MAG: biopolymer transporter ExbD [Cystobacterineae bacterium]|nr:biopolymer transporter ExbD [Cystobacterineae bacterium]